RRGGWTVGIAATVLHRWPGSGRPGGGAASWQPEASPDVQMLLTLGQREVSGGRVAWLLTGSGRRCERDVGCGVAGLGNQGFVDLAGDVPLEAAHDLFPALALGGAPGYVGL